MKKNYGFEEKIAVEEALKALYLYNNTLRFPVEDDCLDKEVLSDYFLSDDVQFCSDCEKKIGAATIRYCYDNPDILNKKRNAQLMYSQMQEAMRGAKIEAEYNCGKYGLGINAEKIREERKRENSVVQKSIFLKNAKKTLQNTPGKIVKGAIRRSITPVIVASLATHGALGAAIATGSITIAGITVGTPLLIGAAVGAAMNLSYEVIKRYTPRPIIDNIKSSARDMMTKAENVIEHNVQRFQSTPVGQKVTTFIREKVAPVVNMGVDLVETAYNKTKGMVKSAWTRFKSFF